MHKNFCEQGRCGQPACLVGADRYDGAMNYDEVCDGFTDYQQLVAECAPMSLVYDAGETFVLLRGAVSVVVRDLGTWRARHRRGLHRLGFRPVVSRGIAVWQWRPTDELIAEELRTKPALPDDVATTAFLKTLNIILVSDELLQDQALRVLRDVFRCPPSDLRLQVPQEHEDDWRDAAGWT
ncbi:MAG: hypothetical protein JWP11_3470 [Frankiales bacterium]|nr:hypothetical protein [Frankiales bacterium]